jgi:hypothetical protein
MESYDKNHWEELISTIIDRIGMDRFIETIAYVADQKGYKQVADHIGRLEILAASEQRVAEMWAKPQ